MESIVCRSQANGMCMYQRYSYKGPDYANGLLLWDISRRTLQMERRCSRNFREKHRPKHVFSQTELQTARRMRFIFPEDQPRHQPDTP